MGLTRKDATRDLQARLRKVLKDLLKPARVKSLVITKAEGSTVRGVLVTVCPIEKTLSGRDFEVGLEGGQGGPIKYVLVDGRKLLPKRTGVSAKRGSGRH